METSSEKDSKKSILDTISKNLLGTENSDGKVLENLMNKGGINIDNSMLPAHLKYKEGEVSLTNLLRGLIKSAKDDSPLHQLSETDLNNMIGNFTKQNQASIPLNYVHAPTSFGTEELSIKDAEQLRSFKKDVRDHMTSEMALEFLKSYHINAKCKFSEQSLIQHLHIILPNKALLTLNHLKKQKATLSQIYTEICFSHGSQKSDEEIKEEIYSLVESSKPPLTVLEELNTLLQSTGENLESINALCLAEARRYVKRVAGQHIATTIENTFKLSQSRYYFEYYRIIKLNFSNDLKKLNKKVNHIDDSTETVSPAEELSQFKQEVLELLTSSINQISVKQPETNPAPQGPKPCFHCQSTEHLVRNCPHKPRFRPPKSKQRSNPPAQGYGNFNSKGYSGQKCSIHKNGNHTNFNCVLQQHPCTFSPTHGTHSAGQCRRRTAPSQNSTQMHTNRMNLPMQMGPPMTGTMQQMMPPQMAMVQVQPQPQPQPNHPQIQWTPPAPQAHHVGQLSPHTLMEKITGAISSVLETEK